MTGRMKPQLTESLTVELPWSEESHERFKRPRLQTIEVEGHEHSVIGVEYFRGARSQLMIRLILAP